MLEGGGLHKTELMTEVGGGHGALVLSFGPFLKTAHVMGTALAEVNVRGSFS